MVILRCTRELLARVTRAPAEPAATSTTRLGDWYVALVRLGRRQYLLAISERTRLPVVVPARDARGMAETLAVASVQRCEYLDGAMHVSPSPSPAHQVAVLRIARALEDYFAGSDREAVVLAGPVAVFLGAEIVAQPDVVVASRKQLSARGVEGAPQLVVEVVTAASAERDRDVKMRSYAAAQVERYWPVDVDRRTAECLGRRRPPGASTVSLSRGVLAPADLPDFELRLETLWL
jgi:Uma2 family endonuclease